MAFDFALILISDATFKPLEITKLWGYFEYVCPRYLVKSGDNDSPCPALKSVVTYNAKQL